MNTPRLIRKIQPYWSHGRFYNDGKAHTHSTLWGTLPSLFKSLFFSNKKISQEHAATWHMPCIPSVSVDKDKPTITWIGHATFLIQLGKYNILTDPIFGQAGFIFPRMVPPGILLRDLPPIHAILISHNHRDHMDTSTLMALYHEERHNMDIFVPRGDKKWFENRGFTKVSEHTWWDIERRGTADGEEVVFTFLPAHHWSQRGLFDKNSSLWGSWMIEWRGYHIYFAGDSAQGEHFTAIGREFDSIDIALMPIGPCEPSEWMRKTHLDAAQAGEAFCALKARHFIPMHWGTFGFGKDTFDLPLQRLQEWWQTCGVQVANRSLHVLRMGEQRSFQISELHIPPMPELEISR